MTFKFPDLRILLFAKEPVYGRVKTRLHNAIGKGKAFELHCRMLRYQVDNIQASRLAPLELWVNGNQDNPVLQSLALENQIYQQIGTDLGQRMQEAVTAARSRCRAAVLVGTDCPSVDRDYLACALQFLDSGCQLVIGPAEDGGYVLLGASESWPDLFSNMPWGTDRVLPLTVERAKQLGLSLELLPSRWDVDRPEDLARLASLDPPLDLDWTD